MYHHKKMWALYRMEGCEYTMYDMETVNTCVILSAIFNLDLQTGNGLRFRNIGNGLLYKTFET
jgi:hypothetical protein